MWYASIVSTTRRYIPALDGLRAIAVLAVFAHHTYGGPFPGGFLGVDLFFAISGFLITNTLLDDVERSGQIRFGAFYARRARRLLPALVLTLLVAYIIWPSAGPAYRPAAMATLFYYANWQHARDIAATLGPLAHAWSLSIEEQFYFVWPATLALVLRGTASLRSAAAWTLGLVMALASFRAYGAIQGSILAAYASTFARMDELLVGSAFALLSRSASGSRPSFLLRGWAGLVAGTVFAVLVLTVHYQDRWLYLGGFTLIALAAGGFVYQLATAESTMTARCLSWRPLVEVGKRSYGIYLFHYPLTLWIGRGWPPGRYTYLAAAFLRLGATLVLAWLSYRFVEEPILRRRAAPLKASGDGAA
jgi:peptidoglycan/LPS O-acetylase OafA/YrhL